MMRMRAGTRLLAAFTFVPALLAALVALAGCGGEERGPVLSGGKEVKSWVAELHNPKPQVRRQAVLKLGNAGDSDPAVAPALAEQLLLDIDAVASSRCDPGGRQAQPAERSHQGTAADHEPHRQGSGRPRLGRQGARSLWRGRVSESRRLQAPALCGSNG